MSGINLHALLLKRNVNILKHTPLIFIVILFSAAADFALWYLGFNGAVKDRSTFITAASAWGLATVAYVATLLQAVTDRRKSGRDGRRAAYATFLAASDNLLAANTRLIECQSAFDNARDELAAAERQYVLSATPSNNKLKIAAEVALDVFEQSLQAASSDAESLLSAYKTATKNVAQLLPQSGLAAFDTFKICPPTDTPGRADARSRFVKAAREDLKLRQRDDESSL